MLSGAMDLFDLSLTQLKRATAIKQRIEALNRELRGILGATANSTAAPKKRRAKRTTANKGPAARTAKRAGRAVRKRKKKAFSAATRAKLSARLKAYWAAKRAGKK